jgi:hypothetical protein
LAGISFDILSSSKFEEFCFNLLDANGFVNLDWRKRYGCRHVPPKELQNLLAWSDAERPEVALFMVPNFLSNPAKEFLEAYRRNHKPFFKVRYWEKPQLVRMLRRKIALQRKYDLADVPMRSVKEIIEAENELFTRVWYGWKGTREQYRTEGSPEDIIEGMPREKRQAEKRFGKKSLMDNMRTEWDWGFVSGKLSAIGWVLGDDWDMLDT